MNSIRKTIPLTYNGEVIGTAEVTVTEQGIYCESTFLEGEEMNSLISVAGELSWKVKK